jgi:MoxR-like ATPase
MAIVLASKARALMQGRSYVNTEDVHAVCTPVLCHRLVTNYTAISAGVRAEDIVRQVLEAVPRPAEAASPRGVQP